jgi:hypothetical protein
LNRKDDRSEYNSCSEGSEATKFSNSIFNVVAVLRAKGFGLILAVWLLIPSCGS